MRALLVLAILAAGVPASAQSLAEVAAKEAARRAAIKHPAKVITEKDLPAETSTAAKVPPAKADEHKTDTPSAGSRAATKTDDNGHDERWWAARAEPLRRTLDSATRRLGIARDRAGAIVAEMKHAGSPTRPGTERRLEAAQLEVNRCEAEVAAARRVLDDLEEEARQAGALPGWLRK